MNDTTLMQGVMVLYLVSAFVYTMSRSENVRSWPRRILAAGLLVQSISLIWRWIHSYRLGYGHAPLSNRYESLVFFSWSLVFLFLIIGDRLPVGKFGGVVAILSAVMIASTSIIPGSDAEILPLMPALNSNWLFFHVVTCFLGYSAFAIASFAGVVSLYRQHKKEGFRYVQSLDEVMHRTVIVGFLLLTLGIVSGSAWAYNAWGRYWGWDPKEVWSLITWIIYAVFLHARITKGWGGKRLAWIAIIGFLAVLFTFLGVNYLPFLKGLHSYA